MALSQLFFHASVTRQRGTGSETRFSRSRVHEKKQPNPCKQGFEKKACPRKLMLKNLVDADENYKLEQRT